MKVLKLFCLVFLCASCVSPAKDRAARQPNSDRTLRVLTLNNWISGDRVPDGLNKLARAIQDSQADVVFLQEADHSDEALAKLTGLAISRRTDKRGTAVLSRYPILKRAVFSRSTGALIDVNGQKVAVVSVHLVAYPYAPYFACFDQKSNAEILKMDDEVRGQDARNDLGQIETEFGDATMMVVGGDFNSPSHLDWTEENKSAHCNRAVPFVATQVLAQHGFTDAFRSLFPNPVTDPGLTWSTREKVNEDHPPAPEPQDRVDFIFYRGRLKATNARTYDNDLSIWPSDHRGVIADFDLAND